MLHWLRERAAGLTQPLRRRRAPRRLRQMRAPRRLRVLRSGAFLIAGTLLLGLATLNTGNNLLYLLMGALLGTIALSGWLSEQALQRVRIRRVLPRAVTANVAARIEYVVHNDKPRVPCYGIRVREVMPGSPSPDEMSLTVSTAFIDVIEAGASVSTRCEVLAPRRGEYALHRIAAGTAFPFGLFFKERDIQAPGALLVWPRTDLPVRPPRVGGDRGLRHVSGAAAARGAERGDFRGLREYRPGDDPRDLHWRTTARRGLPFVREYDRDVAEEYWLVLDTVSPESESGEAAVETAAAVLVLAAARGHRAGLAAGDRLLPPGFTAGGIEAALDMLATVRMATTGPLPEPPAAPADCVLITARATIGQAWGDIYRVGQDGQP